MAYFADDGYLTCSWCGNPDDDRIFEESPWAPWMHLNCERPYSEFFEEYGFYAVEVLKFVRGEASAIMPRTVGEAEAKIAKDLIGMNPSLALPENLQQLVAAVEAVSGGSPPSWPTYRLWALHQRELRRARGYFIERSFNNARDFVSESFSVTRRPKSLLLWPMPRASAGAKLYKTYGKQRSRILIGSWTTSPCNTNVTVFKCCSRQSRQTAVSCWWRETSPVRCRGSMTISWSAIARLQCRRSGVSQNRRAEDR